MEENKKPSQQPLSVRLAGIGAVVLGVLGSVVVGPLLFPNAPGQGYNPARTVCAAVGGGLGALVGWGLGRLIEGPPKAD